jgi:hypothetical protein
MSASPLSDVRHFAALPEARAAADPAAPAVADDNADLDNAAFLDRVTRCSRSTPSPRTPATRSCRRCPTTPPRWRC